MSEKLRGGAFPGFSRIFATDGEVFAPGTIDLTGPIQPVADVSRLAQYQQIGLGAWTTSMSVAHGSANTQRATIALRTALLLLDPAVDPDAVDVWLMGAALNLSSTAQAGNLSEAAVGIIPSNTPPSVAAASRCLIVALWDNYFTTEIISGEGASALLNDSSNQVSPPNQYPIMIRPDTSDAGVALISISSGALTSVVATCRFWITPRNGSPPGMA